MITEYTGCHERVIFNFWTLELKYGLSLFSKYFSSICDFSFIYFALSLPADMGKPSAYAAPRAQRPSLGLHIDGMKSRKLTAKTITPKDIRRATNQNDDQDPYDTYDPTAQEQDEEGLLDAALFRSLNIKASSTVGEIKINPKVLRSVAPTTAFSSSDIDLKDMQNSMDMLSMFDQTVSTSISTEQFEAAIEKAVAKATAQSNSNHSLSLRAYNEQEAQRSSAEVLDNERFNPHEDEYGREPATGYGRADCMSMAAKSILSDQTLADVLRHTGALLSKYKSGTLPKILKNIPASPSWEPIIEVMDPLAWTPHAIQIVTKLFISQLPEDQAYLYDKNVLLEQVKESLRHNKKLPVHIFDALGKATYKPRAFYKGIVFPLANTDAHVVIVKAVASILKKSSIPVQISAPALLKLLEIPYNGAASAFIGSLIEKGYALPVTVVEELVKYYERTASEYRSQQLPLVFHAGLLAFVRKYNTAMTGEQQIRLISAVKTSPHKGGISKEILRLFNESSALFTRNVGTAFSPHQLII
ncbi:Bystin family protein [Giardia duodenalis]|uniref:Bystin family protein n=2 Tax=Giardia intestinalis TaxID=5741 RepID=V6TYV3_GIAIN|nr:Bystin family protein [Giardia intestinalis]